jgi:hypothetical protein
MAASKSKNRDHSGSEYRMTHLRLNDWNLELREVPVPEKIKLPGVDAIFMVAEGSGGAPTK